MLLSLILGASGRIFREEFMGVVVCFVVFYSVGFVTGLFVSDRRYSDTIKGWREQNGRLLEMLEHAGDVIIRQNQDLSLISKRIEGYDSTFIN